MARGVRAGRGSRLLAMSVGLAGAVLVGCAGVTAQTALPPPPPPAPPAPPAQPASPPPPAVGSEPAHEVLGVYIGNGDYDNDLLDIRCHLTNRDVLLPELSERFGVQWVRVALNADREATRAALLDLLERVRDRRGAGAEVTALLFYTGHGSRVPDQDGDEDDRLDETWVATRKGEDDIRDDDIAAWRWAIARTGASLTMIIEACHSETSHRGARVLSRAARGTGGSRLFEGDAAAEWYTAAAAEASASEQRARKVGNDGVDAVGGSARFVCFAATRDRDTALLTEEGGREWGRFSLALLRALRESSGALTYGEVQAEVARQMSKLPKEKREQLPTMVSSAGAEGTVFLGRAVPAAHIRVLEMLRDEALVSAGTELGLHEGSVLAVFASAAARERGDARVGEATVTASGVGQARVRGEAITRESTFALLAGAVTRCAIALSDELPPALRVAISQRARQEGLTIAADAQSAVFVLLPDGEGGARVRWATEPSDAGDADLARIPPTETDVLADRAMRDLAYLVRVRRLLDLSGFESDFTVRVVIDDGTPRTDWDEAPDAAVLAPGQRVRYIIRNQSGELRYLDGVEVTRPDTGGLHATRLLSRSVAVAPGRALVIPAPAREAIEVSLLPDASHEVVEQRWILTRRPIPNLDALLSRGSSPDVTRGQDGHVLASVLGMGTFGSRGREQVSGWAVRGVRFEIAR